MAELSYYDILAKLVSVAKGFSNEIYNIFPAITDNVSKPLLQEIIVKCHITIVQNEALFSRWLWVFSENSVDIEDVNRYVIDILSKEKETRTKMNSFKILYLIGGLNGFLMTSLYHKSKHGTIKESGILNNNSNECGIALFKKAKALWEHRSGGTEKGLNYTNLLSNFYVQDLKMKEKSGYKYENIWCLQDFKTEIEQIQDNKALTIGMTGLSDLKPFKIILGENGLNNTFKVQLLPEFEEQIIPKIISIIKKACKDSVDILIFPEMLGSKKINGKIQDTLFELYCNEIKTPLFVIAPSVWDSNKNELTVFNHTGEEILVQPKFVPYQHEEDGVKYVEDLEYNSTIKVLHIDGLGRVIFPICKSFISPSFKDITEVTKPLLILCPSYSTGYYDFEVEANSFSSVDCNVVWSNCCRALKHPKDTSKITDTKVSDTAKNKEPLLGFITQNGNIYKPMEVFSLDECCKEYNENGCKNDCLKKGEINFKVNSDSKK